MCIKNKELKNELENNKKDIMDAVNIIKEFGPDIKMIHSMLKDHAKRIDEEIQERKDENKNIKDNYLKRFDEIKNNITDVRKDIKNSFIGIATFFLTTITGFLILKILGLL